MKKVKFRKSLITYFIIIFLITNVISIFLFSLYISNTETNQANKYAENSIQEIVKEKGMLISMSLERIEIQAKQLALLTEELMKTSNFDKSIDDSYIENEEGILTRKYNEGKADSSQSNIFVPNIFSDKTKLNYQINLTSCLEKAFENVILSENTGWVYVASEEGLLRCSPYTKLDERYSSDHMQNTDFYYLVANASNNPDKKAIWVEPYIDYLGNGWTMTCSAPIYDQNDTFFGVIGIDLPFENIKKDYFDDFSLGEDETIYWVDSNGKIYYDSSDVEPIDEQGQIYDKSIFEKPFGNEKKNAIKDALIKKEGINYYTENGILKMITYHKIEQTESLLMIEMNATGFRSRYAIDTRSLLFIVAIDICIALLFIFLLYKGLSKPLKKLVFRAQRISNGDYDVDSSSVDSSFYEIEELNKAFETMNHSIEEYIDELVERNTEIQSILDTIDETLMIVDTNEIVLVQSKQTKGIPKESISEALERFKSEKAAYETKSVVDGEVYANSYYPIFDELGNLNSLVISSKCVTQELLLEREMLQIEKMAGIGQISAAIVHELKNKLALIRGAAYILKMTNDNGQDEVKMITEAVMDAEKVITTLLNFSKEDNSSGELIHVGTIIQQILFLSRKEIISKGINIKTDIEGDIYVFSSTQEALKVIFQNIIINAIQAVDSDGIIKISCTQNPELTIIKIRDNGCGIKLSPPERIFEPFITTKENGSGIGLWISRKLTISLGGELLVNQLENDETEFTISLPTVGRKKE